MIKLIIFDIDGTLLNDNKEMLESSKHALSLLKERGYKLGVASGRPPVATKIKQVEDVGFDYYVCSNGSIVVDSNDNILFQKEIEKEVLEDFSNDCEKDNTALMVCFLDSNYSYVNHQSIKKMLFTIVGYNDMLIDNSTKKDRHYKSPPWSMVIWDFNQNIEKYKVKYPSLDFIQYKSNEYDVILKGQSKSRGLNKLCNKIGISMSQVMAFGDHYNDFEMIRDCGIGIAMSNAVEEIKDVSDYITEDNNNHGIEKALKHYNLI